MNCWEAKAVDVSYPNFCVAVEKHEIKYMVIHFKGYLTYEVISE